MEKVREAQHAAAVDFRCDGCGRYCPDPRYDFEGKDHGKGRGGATRCGTWVRVPARSTR